MLRAIVKALPFVVPAALFVAGAACSSSNDCTGPNTIPISSTCEGCAMSSCSSDYASYGSACCSGTDANACETAAGTLEQCLLTNCSSKCQVSTSGSGTGTSTSSGS